ncbi:translation initiation factor eIF-1A [Candidatus Woesearchaeota archaeon]|jgi:translation initiation factor 1A|nr:translation initiation factor eIF-1A [Candidatus Woesearchaeota archaeon]
MPPRKPYKKGGKVKTATEEEDFGRIKLPRGLESFGVVEQRVGGSRMFVRCMDGKKRLCRIPGRLKKRLWVRERDFIIVEPWELGGDEKGDVIFKYRPNQVKWLKTKGYLRALEEADEF